MCGGGVEWWDYLPTAKIFVVTLGGFGFSGGWV